MAGNHPEPVRPLNKPDDDRAWFCWFCWLWFWESVAYVNVTGAQRWIHFHHLIGDVDDSLGRVFLLLLTDARDAEAIAAAMLFKGIVLMTQLTHYGSKVVNHGITLGQGFFEG